MKKLNEKSFVAKLQQNLDFANSLQIIAAQEEVNEEYDAAIEHKREAIAIIVVLEDFAKLVNAEISGQDGDLHIVCG